MGSPPMPPPEILDSIRRGLVIPAHPLALNEDREVDKNRMRVLTRYYLDAGVGGLAVGVHTTQFEIHNPDVGLYKPVLWVVSGTVRDWVKEERPVALIAGICGNTPQAVDEATSAVEIGYHAGLLNLGALWDATNDELLDHCRAVADIIPLFGFYLQSSAGGRKLDFDFWKRFAEIENVVAIKIAPFNRYATLEVARAVFEAGRAGEVLLYTGNDDNIAGDLLTTFHFGGNETGGNDAATVRIVGGLLGQWAVWTKAAVDLFNEIQTIVDSRAPVPAHLLTFAAQLTDANGAIFDAANNFSGCIPGINEILRRQGFLEGRWCLDRALDLSPGQAEQIDRVSAAYPHLKDDAFVAQNYERWAEKG